MMIRQDASRSVEMLGLDGKTWCRAACIGVAVALMGCQVAPSHPPEGSPTPTEDEVRLRQQGGVFNTTAQGCVTGILVGALIGGLVARKAGAVIGAGAGLAVGCMSGYWLQTVQQRHAVTEADLNALIGTLQKTNADVAALTTSAKRVIAADKERIARIDTGLKKKRISMEEAKTEMAQVDSNKDYLKQTIVNLEQQVQDWHQIEERLRKQKNAAQTKVVEQEINKLERQVAVLESELGVLVKRRQLSRVG